MINFKSEKILPLLALAGLGLYTQNSEKNLANNTTILLLLFFLIMEDERINELEEAVCHYPAPYKYTQQERCHHHSKPFYPRGCYSECYR